MGKWGNGYSRVDALNAAGYDADAIQTIVNSLVRDGALPDTSNVEIKLGDKTKTIDIDLSVYNSLTLNLHFGDVNG